MMPAGSSKCWEERGGLHNRKGTEERQESEIGEAAEDRRESGLEGGVGSGESEGEDRREEKRGRGNKQ
jgi:hypothetical protein